MYGTQAIVTVASVNLALCWLTLLLRCYVRIFLVRRFWWDDALACASLVRPSPVHRSDPANR